MHNYFSRYLLFVLTALLLAACESTAPVKKIPPPKPIYSPQGEIEKPLRLGAPIRVRNAGSVLIYPTDFDSLSGWDHDNHAAAFASFQRSCERWRKQPEDKMLGGVFELGRVGDWKKLCYVPVHADGEKRFFEQ